MDRIDMSRFWRSAVINPMPSPRRNRRFGRGRRTACGKAPPSHAFDTVAEFDAANYREIVATDTLGNTVLHRATQRGNLKAVIAALHRVPISGRAAFANAQTHPSSGRTGCRTALHEAALRGNVRIATCLLMHGARIDVRDGHGRTPFEIWARMGHPVAEISSLLALLGVAGGLV